MEESKWDIEKAEKLLYSLIYNPQKLSRDEKLEQVKTYVRLLQFSPILKGMPTIHVAGTKGKGSTVAYLESMARASGLKTGTSYIAFPAPLLLNFLCTTHTHDAFQGCSHRLTW